MEAISQERHIDMIEQIQRSATTKKRVRSSNILYIATRIEGFLILNVDENINFSTWELINV